MKLQGIALLAIGLGSAAGVNAQATSPAERTRITPLAPVVVTATRVADDPLLLPTAIDAINADDIRRAQPRLDVGEALQRVPGLVARDRQNQAQDLQLSIRGFGARAAFGVRGVRLYTDGIPATMPDGQGQLGHFPLESVDRIEVLRGPFSVLYGNAAGGVVSLSTAAAPPHPTANIGITFGEDALRRESLSLQASWHEVGDALVDIVRIVGDGYRTHSASQRRSGQMLLRGGWGRNGRFTALFNHFDLVADDPQGLSAAQLAGDRRAASAGAIAFDTRKTVRQDQAGFRLEHALGGQTTFVATAWNGSRKTFQMLSVPVSVQQASARHSGGAIDLDRDYGGIDARIRWTGTLIGTPLALTAGVDHEVAEERRRGFENFIGNRLGVVGALRRDEDNRVHSRDAYLQAEWTPAPRWRVHAGLRHGEVRFVSRDRFVTSGNPDDSGSVAYASTSPAVGVLFRATPWLSVYANSGSGFETPTFSELAYRRDGEGGLNDGLRPARSVHREVGLRLRRQGFEAAAAAFHVRTRDELGVASNEDGRSVYANTGRTVRRGVELSVSAPLAAQWQLAAHYTLLDGRFTDRAACQASSCQAGPGEEASHLIAGLARSTAWAELRWSASARTDLLLQGRFVDRVFADDANTAFAPAFASVNLAAEHRVTIAGLDWRAFARLNNVTDRDVIGSVIVNATGGRYFEPAPGRHWIAGLTLTRTFK